MNDQNETSLSGTIERIRQITTKTGAAMAEIILKVRKDRFRVVSHGNVAKHLLASCNPGDRLTVNGTLATSSWKDETTGEWRNSFSVTAWGAEIDGEVISYQREERSTPHPKASRRDEIPMAQHGDYF